MSAEDLKEVYLYIKKDDLRLQEIFSRLKNPRHRNEFTKEAIIYWYFILKNSPLSSRNFYMDSSEKTIVNGLLPVGYYRNRLKANIKDKNVSYEEAITIRFPLKNDEVYIEEILNGVLSLSEFTKEAIVEWDCLLNHSNLFISRYLQKRTDVEKSWGEVLYVSEYNDDYNVPNIHTQTVNPKTVAAKVNETTFINSKEQTPEVETINNDVNERKDNINSQNKIEPTNNPPEKTNERSGVITRGKKNSLAWG